MFEAEAPLDPNISCSRGSFNVIQIWVCRLTSQCGRINVLWSDLNMTAFICFSDDITPFGTSHYVGPTSRKFLAEGWSPTNRVRIEIIPTVAAWSPIYLLVNFPLQSPKPNCDRPIKTTVPIRMFKRRGSNRKLYVGKCDFSKGKCSGLPHHFGWDPIIYRVAHTINNLSKFVCRVSVMTQMLFSMLCLSICIYPYICQTFSLPLVGPFL